jgi:hypothetical protein
MDYKLWREAVKADDDFHAAVVSVYGKANAGNMRYAKEAHCHPLIKPKHEAWLKANAAWMAVVELHYNGKLK